MRPSLAAIALMALSPMVMSLSACNRTAEMPTRAFTAPGVTMKLTPAQAPDCKPGTTYAAVLEWSVPASDTPKTDVRIDSPTGQIFGRSNDIKASKQTDKWVKPGTWFLLLDRRSGELLGALQAGPKACP